MAREVFAQISGPSVDVFLKDTLVVTHTFLDSLAVLDSVSFSLKLT